MADAAPTDVTDDERRRLHDRVRHTVTDALGRLSDTEKERLHGPTLDAGFVRRKVRELHRQRRWVLPLSGTMLLLAIALPTTRLFTFIEGTDSIARNMLYLRLGAWSAFAALQAGVGVYLYMRWRRRLDLYRALDALTPPAESEPEEAPA